MKSPLTAVNILLAALIVYTYAIRYREHASPQPPDLRLIPAAVGDYVSTDERQDARNLEVLGADATLFRTYRREGGNAVWLFVGYFASQQENAQIHSPKHCYPGGGWNIVEEGPTAIRMAGSETAIKHLIITDGVETQFVLYWYASADGIITNEYALKWNQMKNSLRGKAQETAFVQFSTLLPGGEADDGAREGLVALAETLIPAIDMVLAWSGVTPPPQERTQ